MPPLVLIACINLMANFTVNVQENGYFLCTESCKCSAGSGTYYCAEEDACKEKYEQRK